VNFPDFIDAYMDYTFESEAPDAYHRWVAMSIIGSAVGRRVKMEGAGYDIYPNQFILLIGPPGRTRKSTAIKAGRKILEEVPGITIAPQSLSRERLIEVFEDAYDEWRGESNVYLPSSEFGTLVNTSGVGMLMLLTHLYNGDESVFKHETKGSGSSEVKNPILSVLGATTPIWMQTEYPSASIEDGFAARIIFIVEEHKRKLIAFPKPFDDKVKKKLVEDLTEISKRKGVLGYTPKGAQLFEEFYQDMHKPKPMDRDARMESFYDRSDVHMHKTGMICALSRGSDVIDSEDVIRAYGYIAAIESKLTGIYSFLGNNKSLGASYQIQELVRARKKVPLSAIFRMYSYIGSFQEIEMAIKLTVSWQKVSHVIDSAGDYLLWKGDE
jgi:hypothetical protein